MKKKRLLFKSFGSILLVCATVKAYGQLYAKKNLIEDLTFLNEAVVNGHPVNYTKKGKHNLEALLEEVQKTEKDSLSALDYSLWIEKGVYNIGCVHTSTKSNPLLSGSGKQTYAPFSVFPTAEGLKITACADASKKGMVITSINGTDAGRIIKSYGHYRASDGGTAAFSKAYFGFAGSRLIAELLNHPQEYELIAGGEKFTLKAVDQIFLPSKSPEPYTPVLTNENNSLLRHEGVDVLRIASFQKSDISFFKKVFKRLQETGSQSLLIDLRQNTGGNRKAAVALTRYLANRSFSYSILQPQLKTYPYLNPKGKVYFLLSKLRYNVFQFFFYQKITPNGRGFTYRYRPINDHHYEGKIYVLTDGFTASASTMVTSWLKQYTSATFLGAQSAGGYNGNNGGAFPLITLPQSKITITFPAYRLIMDPDSEQTYGIIPDRSVDPQSSYAEIIKTLLK